ncbi:hypothetical protein L0Y59_01645 [Candidatus Uhrbacteria bacterium]|nr:hypothetical protein [Candidatus Uhrbacteria bacterium]
MACFAASTAVLLATACASNHDVVRMHNGQPIARYQGSVGYRSSESTTQTFDTLMPSCIAHVGQMPGGEEVGLCAQKTRIELIQEAYPYGMYAPYGYGYGYSPSGMPMTYGYAVPSP